MPASQVLIGYSPTLGARRTVVVPDTDAQVPGLAAWLKGTGEAVLLAPYGDYLLYGPDALLARYLGRQPQSDRCAVVSAAGVVVALVHADPALDTHPAGTLRPDPHGRAAVGQPASFSPF